MYISFSASDYTSAYMNPSLAYGLTFNCPGFSWTEYAAVYWLGPITGKIQRKHNLDYTYQTAFLKLVMSPFGDCQHGISVPFSSTGMSLALFLYMGHIPRVFSKNLLYSQKTRFRVPKGNSSGEQEDKKKK